DADAAKSKLISLAREDVNSPLDRILLGVPRLNTLDRFLEQAGVSYGPATAVTLSLVFGFLGALLTSLVFRNFALFSLVLGFAAAAALFWFRLSKKRKKRRDKLVRQIPDALDFFARSLRAGNPFAGAIKSASEELQDPLAGELAITFDELNYGLEFEESMKNLAARVDSEELRLFVTAVLVQKSTGGNLAELMNRISKLLRERITMRGEVRIQAAEMRASAQILIALPIFIAGLLQLVNPEYLPILFENSLGRTIIMIQVGLMAFGYFIINRMVDFRI
ncbi:MAG: type II secretion system F family protein, partial [Gammaproteobacteria bacterium]|nr:type II secretion system F family protein [Gammaproteobacteria bacterium]